MNCAFFFFPSPESVRQRTDFFYVKPEVASSSEEFSSSPLEKYVLESLLTQVLLVRDIYRERGHEEEEEEEEGV